MGEKISISISRELLPFIKETAEQLKTQSNRGTDTPIFRIYEKKLVIAAKGCGDRYRRESEEVWDDLCESCREIMLKTNGEWSKLPDLYMDNCECDESLFFWANEELVPVNDGAYSGVGFLTEKAAKDYLEANSYHFNQGVVYAESAFRNVELKHVIRLIQELGEEIYFK